MSRHSTTELCEGENERRFYHESIAWEESQVFTL